VFPSNLTVVGVYSYLQPSTATAYYLKLQS